MFNLNKSTQDNINEAQAEIKSQSSELIDNTKARIADISADVKNKANNIGDKVQAKATETKQDALDLVNNLKALLAKTEQAANPEEVKDEVTNRLVEWKSVIAAEVKNAVDTSKAQTEKVVRDQPLVSLAVAVGAGVLIGYLLGNKDSK